jgi:hypothetical protein
MSRISDLILAQGDAKAGGIAARGQMWGNVVGQGTFSFANALQQRQQAKAESARREALTAAVSNGPPNIADLVRAGMEPKEAMQVLADYARSQPEPVKPIAVESEDEAGNPITTFVVPEAGKVVPRPKPKPAPTKFDRVSLRGADGQRMEGSYDPASGKYYTSTGDEITHPVLWTDPSKPTEVDPASERAALERFAKELGKTVDQLTDDQVNNWRRRRAQAVRFEDPKSGSGAGEWVTTSSGDVVRRVPQAGDKPYDQVAVRQQNGNKDPNAEALDTMREVARVATALRDSKGFGGTFGLYDSQLPTVFQGTADAEGLLESLQGLLTLDNVGKLKGVLSDSDMKIIRAASTTLKARMGDKAARKEVERIITAVSNVKMKAPNGQVKSVPLDQVEHYIGLGATVVN